MSRNKQPKMCVPIFIYSLIFKLNLCSRARKSWNFSSLLLRYKLKCFVPNGSFAYDWRETCTQNLLFLTQFYSGSVGSQSFAMDFFVIFMSTWNSLKNIKPTRNKTEESVFSNNIWWMAHVPIGANVHIIKLSKSISF